MHKYRLYIIISCSYLMLLGCAIKLDNWLTSSPIDEFADSKEENFIPDENVFEVPATNISKAVVLLDESAIIQLEEPKAMELLGKGIKVRVGYSIFLVRGLTQNQETGSFQCHYYKKMLLVSYQAMGSKSTPIKKQPIIILLHDKPSKIFVNCSVME